MVDGNRRRCQCRSDYITDIEQKSCDERMCHFSQIVQPSGRSSELRQSLLEVVAGHHRCEQYIGAHLEEGLGEGWHL